MNTRVSDNLKLFGTHLLHSTIPPLSESRVIFKHLSGRYFVCFTAQKVSKDDSLLVVHRFLIRRLRIKKPSKS